MVPLDKQTPTVIRPSQIGTDTTYEPPLRIGFGINDETVKGANVTMGRTILYGKIRVWFSRSDGSDRKEVILEGGDFVFIPAGAIHVISNASETEEASLIFCYIGVGNTDAAETVWIEKDSKIAKRVAGASV